MKISWLLSLFITLISFVNSYSQADPNSSEANKVLEIKGLVLDANNQTGLPYTNIYALNKNKGTITNEKGEFKMDISDLDKTDTLRFQYIGYKTQMITVAQLEISSTIYLKEEIFNIGEVLVFGDTPDPETIVKNVLINKAANYKKTTSKKQAFIRERNISDINNIELDYKKSSITDLDEEVLATFEENIPKHTTSFRDFLGYLYLTKNEKDSITFKVDPIRTVSLKEKEISELDQLESIFEDAFTNTQEDEYWKIKTGILGLRVDVDGEPEDSLNENQSKLAFFRNTLNGYLRYSLLDNENQWEFLYKTGRYEYELTGGTRVNGEDAYIIDFTAKKKGRYNGRMYISLSTFALLRADYKYAPNKIGKNIHLLGIGYTESEFAGSIYFEKKDDNYDLKYFSYKMGNSASIDRKLSLIKKRKRFLFDEKMNEIKFGLNFSMDEENLIEYLVLEDETISNDQFNSFKQQKYMETIYVDQFSDKLWQGFSIIEPTTQMKEYKKQSQ